MSTLYEKEFMLYTDHKPLEVIYSPKSKPPPRTERWALRLQPYNFRVVHMLGKTNTADVLSRLPLEGQPNREQHIAEEYINYIASNAVPKSMSQTEIVAATKADPLLQKLRESRVVNGQTYPSSALSTWSV